MVVGDSKEAWMTWRQGWFIIIVGIDAKYKGKGREEGMLKATWS